MEHLTAIGSVERAEYLHGRALHAARELLPRGHDEIEDLASDILIWALRRDQRAKAEGAAEGPRYTKVCLRYAGIDALRRARKVHRRSAAPLLISLEIMKRELRHDETPEAHLLAREAVGLEIRRRRRAGRVVPLL